MRRTRLYCGCCGVASPGPCCPANWKGWYPAGANMAIEVCGYHCGPL